MKKEELLKKIDINRLPAHIAIIMDGNGRWAGKRKFPKIIGHRQGVKSVQKAVKECGELGIKVLTLYAFSTENWKRPGREVKGLMKLLSEVLKREIKKLNENNVKIKISGELKKLAPVLQELLNDAMRSTGGNSGLILNIALNYGGRQEIVEACRKIAREVNSKRLKEKDINEDVISRHLYSAGMPDPDLLIRTSGEHRISNFMLYQIAYTEIYVTDVLWPDFNERHLYEAIIDFQKRDRRFGSS